MTIATPPIAARGKFFCGSRISPAVKLTSCHPSYAQSTATSATPTAAIGTGPAGSCGAAAAVAAAASFVGPGRRKITATMITRPPTLSAVRTLPTRAPFLTPMALIQVRTTIATTPATFAVAGLSGMKAPR